MITIISSLPEDITMYHIKPCMALDDLYLTNKNDYKKYKNEKLSSLSNSNSIISSSYIGKIIRKDYAFLFEIL